MSNGPVLPEVPDSWGKFLREVAQIILLLANLYFAVRGNNKVDDVQTHQEVNTQKLDVAAKAATEAKTEAEAAKQVTAAHTAKIETKLETLSSKADVIKSAVDKPK